MRFDPVSFLLGFLSASGLSLIAWRSRRRLASIQQSAESQIEGTRRFIGRTADARYAKDLLSYLQAHHLAGNQIKLTDILLEPRLIPAAGPLTPPDSEDQSSRSVFEVVPQFHDLPYSYAPFNIETLALGDLGAGDRHIALLGLPGMGKTTTLVTLALMALREVEFQTLEDITQQAIQEDEQALSQADREQRARERARIQERALERLHDAHAKQRQHPTAVPVERLPVLDFSTLLPVLVHLGDIHLAAEDYSKDRRVDPAEPLVRAVQQEVTAITGQVVGSILYPALESGKALILVDGFDDLSPAVRAGYLDWLQQLITEYGHNPIVITGPAIGYDALIHLGFTPVFLRPWREEDYTLLARRWSAVWATRSKQATLPDEQTMRRIGLDNRGRSILDVTLKIWTGLANDARQTGRGGWYDAFVNRHLSEPAKRGLLPVIATRQLENGGPVERDALRETLTSLLTADEDSKKSSRPDDILDNLVRDGLLVRYANGSLGFRHSQLAAYLAGELLAQQGEQRLAEVALDPTWQDAIAFAAASTNLYPAIQRKLSSAPDLLYSNLFGLVHWLPDAPPDAPWRGDLFKRLAAALMAPVQYPAVRERAMAALIASRDRNVVFILRQALRAADPHIRQLACVGLGALGNPETVKDLEPFLGDQDSRVQLAAGLALGAIGTEKALEVMVQGLTTGTETLRRAVAEALAAIPNEGHAILRDGIEAKDIRVRRATVYGLSRVKAPWAVMALYQAMLEDAEWYVRSAAEEAFIQAQTPEEDGPRSHPEADSLPWLIEWAAERGEGVPAGVNARQVLVRVLHEGQPIYKALAAATLARLGHTQALKPLYATLRDRDPGVRGATYAALADLQVRLGEPLPGLN